MIADEVMAGFGRTGEWFAIDHWKVVPDLICMAKGLTASYLPLGAVGMRHHIAQHFQDKVFYGGLTYNSHPMGCAAALATIRVYEEDHLIDNAKKMGVIMKQIGSELQAKASIGRSSKVNWTVRYLRTGPKPKHKAAHGSFQRHVGRNGGTRPFLP